VPLPFLGCCSGHSICQPHRYHASTRSCEWVVHEWIIAKLQERRELQCRLLPQFPEDLNNTFHAMFAVLHVATFPVGSILEAESEGIDIFQCNRLMGKLFFSIISIDSWGNYIEISLKSLVRLSLTFPLPAVLVYYNNASRGGFQRLALTAGATYSVNLAMPLYF